jgi:hypothetical protein
MAENKSMRCIVEGYILMFIGIKVVVCLGLKHHWMFKVYN